MPSGGNFEENNSNDSLLVGDRIYVDAIDGAATDPDSLGNPTVRSGDIEPVDTYAESRQQEFAEMVEVQR